jgi:UDP:flavonoid glycosyltransferase YjiC (YdhE family)
MVPLARALLSRGHDVLWATGADACERLAREGFRAAAAGLGERQGMADLYRRFPQIHSMPPSERPDFMFPRFFGSVRAVPMQRDLEPLTRSWSPELCVCDAAEFAGHLQAAALGVPSVTHSFGALLPEHRVAAAAAELAPMWVERGLTPRPYGGAYDRLYIDIYPPSLQPGERPHVSATQLLGPSSFATAGDEALPHWVGSSAPTPLVYVTFGTVFSNNEALSNIVSALAALPVRVVVTVGPHGEPESLGTQPDNVHVARYVPQDQLLPHCALVVSHAGSGTFLASLAAKIPQLCVPQAADQFINAAACQRSGSGLALEPGTVSVSNVRAAVERLLADDTFRAGAARVSREITMMPTPAEVADRIESEFC